MAWDSGVRVLPPVTLDQVLGLVRFVNSMGGKVDSSRLDEMLNVDMDLLPHVVEAAVILGLLKEEGGDLEITEHGRTALKARGKSLRALIKDLSDDVEPFKEILGSLRGDSIERDRLKDVIRRAGYPDVDRAAKVFTEWLTYMGVEVLD
ncbi:MAG: AAA-associated domain-containing protein [Acidilobus sp.]